MSKEFVVKTGRIGYQSADALVLDTTAKAKGGKGKVFAPTWDMVMASKRGEISWAEYTAQYLSLLRRRYKQNRRLFEEVVAARDVVVLCYCQNSVVGDRHCHRYLLADVLVKVATSLGYDAKYGGEVMSDSSRVPHSRPSSVG